MCTNKIDIHTGRHSLAHVLAKAVTELFEDVKLAIGPAIDTGFYYDFDMNHVITEDDFKNIEKRMLEIINRHENFTKKMIGIDDALKLFKSQPYKLELIEGLKDKGEDMSVYYLGDDFYDLCRGPHVENTKDLKNWSFKISNVAGAYWHGTKKIGCFNVFMFMHIRLKLSLKSILIL